MKFIALASLLGFASFAQAQAPAPFVLKGQLGPLAGPAKVYLRREGLQRGAITDSAEVKNGAFEMKGTVAAPTRARLVLVRNGQKRRLRTGQADNTVFYLEKGTLSLTSPDSLVSARLTGSALTAQHQELAALLKPNTERQTARWKKYGAATPEQRQAPEFAQQHEALGKQLEAEFRAIYTTYIKAHPQSIVSLDAVKELGGAVPQYTQVAPLFELLAPAVRATPDGQAYDKQLQALKRVAVGAVAPNFTLYTPEGQPVSLASLRGKYVLVDFWASWCGPCRQENPNVLKVYNEYRNRNFEVLGVSLDEEKAQSQWLKAIKDDNLTWPQVADLKKGWGNEASQLYSIQAIPQNFLLDPSGKIVAVNLRGGELKTAVARYIP